MTALAGAGQLAWLAGAAAAWSALLFALPLDPDYTAGELVDHLAAWRQTGVLYPELGSGPPYRVFNYPPLALLSARGLAALGLSEISAGRAVNALGFLALVGAVAWWVRARGARGAALAGTVGLLGASFPVLYGAGQFHIEMWAAAGTVAGFALLDRGVSLRAFALGGAALALACFCKQTQVVPAAVALSWAWTCRRPAAPAATTAFAALGVLGSALITVAWGFEPWRHMLTYTVGTYSLPNLGFQALSHAAPWLLLLGFAAHTARGAGRGAARDAALWFWGGALLWSLSAARVGSGFPYFLDLHLATAIWAGPRIFAGGAAGPSRVWAWLLAAQIVGADIGAGAALAKNVVRLRRLDDRLPMLCARLGEARSILAEDVGLARACGRAVVLHPFIMTSLAAQGRWDPAALVGAVRRGEMEVALLPFDPREPAAGVHAERWPPSLLAAVAAAPVVEQVPPGLWVLRW